MTVNLAERIGDNSQCPSCWDTNAQVGGGRRAEDLSIAVDIILRSVPAIDDLIQMLDSAGGSARMVGALRAELARRRGGGRR